MRPRRRLRRLGLTGLAVVLGLVVAVTLASVGYDVATAGTVPVPPLDAHGHYVRTGEVITHYEQWGDRGTPVVLVHGFLESAYVWHAMAPLLARDHRVFALDVRGFGYTQRRGPYTLASDTRQLTAFLSALHLDARHHALPLLVGHSSGAAIVGDVARLHPSAVAGIVFLDGDGTPYGAGPGWVHRLLVDPYLTSVIRLVIRHPSLVRRVYRSACGPGCPSLTGAELDAWVRPFRVPGAESALEQILRAPLIGLRVAQLRAVRVPAAVVRGQHSPVMSAALARATAERLHTKATVTIAGARHLVMVSDPARLAEVLDRLSREI